MKIRFNSQKEKDPAREDGLRVLYAPGKRASFRLRWYLILAVVSAPFVWFLFKVLTGVLLLDVPARLTIPADDIRALESGTVTQLIVNVGDHVTAGQTIARLRNDELAMQLAQLTGETGTTAQTLAQQRRDALLQLLERAETQVDTLRALVERGAATLGELRAAQDLRDARLGDLLAFEQSLQPTRAQQVEIEKNSQSRELLEARVSRLMVTLPYEGMIQSLEVAEGGNVGPGTLIATVQRKQPPELTIFLPAQHGELAKQGQSFRIQLPDNTWHEAKVVSEYSELQRIPPDLRSPFGGDEPHLILNAETVTPLPERWHRDNVPLTARFPNWLQRNWPL